MLKMSYDYYKSKNNWKCLLSTQAAAILNFVAK